MSVGQVKLEDSNMANYGSEEHREMKKEAAQKEPAWEGVGNEPGIQVWRIEKFKVAHWPKDRYGEFYSGELRKHKKQYFIFYFLCYCDFFYFKKTQKNTKNKKTKNSSYICLNTKVNDEGKKEYDVFFWLGAETTQDEAGTAAYKTVELDDLLGDEPVQYREVQGNTHTHTHTQIHTYIRTYKVKIMAFFYVFFFFFTFLLFFVELRLSCCGK